MKAAVTAFLILLAVSLAGAEPVSLRIASWNVQNYLLQNRWAHDAFRFAYPKPEKGKAFLRRTLLRVQPDVLLLQEFGSEDLLRELREDLAASGLVYPYLQFTAIPDARTGLGLMARVPPESVLLLEPRDASGEGRILRGVQEISIRFGGLRLIMFQVHLKSRYTSDEADPDSVVFRTRELVLLQGMLDSRVKLAEPADRLLLAGDFNAPVDSPLLDGLRQAWMPFLPVDARGETWTYHHFKSDSRETIDGFWQPLGQSGFYPVGLFPLSRDRPAGSDHRLVVVEWRP